MFELWDKLYKSQNVKAQQNRFHISGDILPWFSYDQATCVEAFYYKIKESSLTFD